MSDQCVQFINQFATPYVGFVEFLNLKLICNDNATLNGANGGCACGFGYFCFSCGFDFLAAMGKFQPTHSFHSHQTMDYLSIGTHISIVE